MWAASAPDRRSSRRASVLRARSVVMTVLLIMLGGMIVRDLLARRWSAPGQPSHDVTQRSL
ncbi:MAG: hypothetical protein JO052_06845 [Bradyrhizobium sp.]|nr:hypothetical protein [Bradyrhizobium sp.]